MPRRGLAALGPISPASPAGFLPSEISARRGCSLLPAGSVPWVARRGARSGPLRGARASTCAKPRRSVRGARQELKARRQKAAGRPRLFHAPSLFPMKLCLASPFKFPPPFETLRMRSPSPFPGGPRRCVCVRAVHAGRAEGGRAIRCWSPGSRRGEGAADSTSGRPASLGTAPGAGTGERRSRSPDVVEPKQTRSSRARRHAHLPPGGLVAAE